MIIAVDFDGVLCEDNFPDIGNSIHEAISFVRTLQDAGIETILWTSRVGDRLKEAREWCEDYGLHFTSVNGPSPTNIKEYGTDPRKVFANYYMDDRSPHFMKDALIMGHEYALKSLISDIKFCIRQEGVLL